MKFKLFCFLLLFLALGLTRFSSADDRDDREDRHLKLIALIPVPGKPLTSFDISWVDACSRTYFLSDRSNFGVDMFDADENTFLGRVTGFAGPSTSNDTAGPDGIVVIPRPHQLWAGDGDSTVKVVDLGVDPPQIVDTISTGGSKRADELSFDPKDHLILVANDADDPPFVSFISTDTHKVVGKINFPEATNGLEQSVWDPGTKQFYLSVPELNGDPAAGEIAVIDPGTMQVTDTFAVSECQPAGLALGPRQHLLVGCENTNAVVFPPKIIILDARTGDIVANITQVGGADEVWFNRGDHRFYLAARDNPAGPVLGVINARTNTWVENIPTSFNAHSVAADQENNHIFVPLRPPRANTTDPDPCVQFGGAQFTGRGCIGVFSSEEEDHDRDHDHD